MKNTYGTSFFILAFLWTLFNFILAANIELANDEAYYVFYSTQPAWGYFDHPPMIAWLIKAGVSLFGNNEFGVRFFVTLLQPIYLFLLWLTIKPPFASTKDVILFFLVSFSMPLLQLYGFLALPDAPLMFFGMFFIWAYFRFIKNSNWTNTLLMCIGMATVMYSKYQGLLIIIAVLISHPKILTNYKFYLSVISAIILYFPHLMWQHNHNWISVSYHFNRSDEISIKFLFEFLVNAFAALQPLFITTLLSAWRQKSNKQITFKVLLACFLLFFFVLSFNHHIQIQWLIPITFSVIAIVYSYIIQINNRKTRKYVQIVCIIAFILFIGARIFLLFPPPDLNMELFKNRISYQQLYLETGGIPFIFDSDYSAAAKSSFYAKQTTFAQPSIYSRSSQYALSDIDTQLKGKCVAVEMLCATSDCATTKLVNGREIYYRVIKSFTPTRKIKITNRKKTPFSIRKGQQLVLDLDLKNPYSCNYTIDSGKLGLFLIFKHKRKVVKIVQIPVENKILEANGHLTINAAVEIPDLPANDYKIGLTLRNNNEPSWFNSKPETITIYD